MLEITTVSKGAELVSAKIDGKEKIHNGLTFWNRHSPILFPIVGQIKNGKTIIEENEYFMSQHGFARDMDFEKIGQNEYLLKYNEETLKKYPYKFELYVKYIVKDNTLTVKYKVKNIDDKEIYFGLGAHPAFKCDYTNNKCSIKFENTEEGIEIYQLQNGLINPEKCNKDNFFVSNNEIELKKDIFKNDAIILTNLNSNRVYLVENEEKILEFDFSGFKYLGIWSKENAPFVCIEPWHNTTDKIDSDGIFKNKKDIIYLKENQEFKSEYKINFI